MKFYHINNLQVIVLIC